MILITGASGKVGGAICRQLAERGIAVRVMLRDHAQAEKLPPGTEIVVGSYDDPESLSRACAGVQKLFMASFMHPDIVVLQGRLLTAAKSEGVEHVVRISSVAAGPEWGFLSRYHHHGDVQLKDSGVSYTILRAGWFNQNFLAWCPQLKLHLPAADACSSFVDLRDIGAMGVAALTEAGHKNAVYDVTGPEALSFNAAAKILSEETGREFSYVARDPADYRAHLEKVAPFPEFIDAWEGVFARARAGHAASVSDDVPTVLKRPAITLREFAAGHVEALLAQA